MAPVILELKKHSDIETKIIASGQHREMLRQVLNAFNLVEDLNFDVMKQGQSLAYITSSVLNAMDDVIVHEVPDIVVAQGDTTTTFVAGMASFYRQVPFAHVEAGLRTDTIFSPFPEEFNRRAVSQVTRLHFAPTYGAAKHLLEEHVPQDWIRVTGNTSIDAILNITKRLGKAEPMNQGKMILVTTHRRENWGEPQKQICKALIRILDEINDAYVVLPMHLNRTVRDVLKQELGDHKRVHLIEPPDYPEFAQLMLAAEIILTDSGGVQEEAPSLGKPVLVLRSETERPEGVESGNAIIVGTNPKAIFERTTKLLTDNDAYQQMAQARNPYGDGLAASRIVAEIRKFLGLQFEKITQFNKFNK
jgi:UDP-N-acetylglucosamine 2-epimerase (non-hydrolysing)